MALKASTGLRNKMITSSALTTAMNNGFINIYSGPPPLTADAAATGTLLCVISNNGGGGGLNFDPLAVAGVAQKLNSEVWVGTNLATGVAGYYRHVAPADTAGESSTEARLQGSTGVAGADMNLTSVNLAMGAVQTLDFYTVSLPTF